MSRSRPNIGSESPAAASLRVLPSYADRSGVEIPPVGPARGTDLTGYASTLLQAHILAAPNIDDTNCRAIEGAILFLDIVESTALTDSFAVHGPAGAERLGVLLDVYFGAVFRTIDAHGGDVIRIDGDSVFALWQPEPGTLAPAARAAAAAHALRQDLRGWTIDGETLLRQRIVVTAGALTVLSLALPGEQRIFLLAGEPLRGLRDAVARCAPDEVLLQADIDAPREAALAVTLFPVARHAEPDESRLRAFLPRVIVDRSTAGQTAGLAEFRSLSAVFVHLPSVQADAAAGTVLQAAAVAIQNALLPLGLAIWDLLEGDKGVVLKVVTGLPPFARDNNATAAVEAARRIQHALSDIGLSSSIGVATDRTFCGEVGSTARREFTTIGPVMNNAVRLMQMGDAAILCDEHTAGAAGEHFQFEPAIAVQVKGKPRPMLARRLLGRIEQPRRLPDRSAIFGRQAEREVLDDCVDRLEAGEGSFVVVEAEPGAGKSCLLSYLWDLAASRGHRVLVGAAEAVEQQTSYYVFRAILRQSFERAGVQLSAADMGGAVTQLLHGSPLAEHAAILEDIIPLGLPKPTRAPQLSTAARRDFIAELTAELLCRQAASPTVLLIDDVHWIDPSSAHLLGSLSRLLPGLLVAMTSRLLDANTPTHVRALVASRGQRLTLGRLDGASIAGILRETLGAATVPQRLVRFVQARAEGLPLYAEQLVLVMRDQGLIAVSEDGLRLTMNLDGQAEIQTLRDVIISRIDLLPPPEQGLLKLASVIGRNFDLELLGHLYSKAPATASLDRMIASLSGAGLLERDANQGVFRHILLQQEVYELLPYAQRRVLHRRAAEALERNHGVEIEPQFAALAVHWERAGEPAHAAQYRMRAASRAFDRFAHLEAVEQLKAIEQMGGHETLLATNVERAEYARIRGVASHELSDFAEARRWLEECAARRGLSVGGTRPAMIAGVCREVVTQAMMRSGLWRRSPPRLAERDRLLAHIHMRFAEHSYFRGDALALLYSTLVALNRAERADARAELIAACGGVAIGLGFAGRHGLARFYRDRAIAIGAAAEPGDRGLSFLLAAVYSFAAGDWTSVLSSCLAGATLYEQVHEHFRYCSCHILAGFARLAIGDLAGAERDMTCFGADAEAIDNAPVRSWALCGLALLALLRGNAPETAVARIAAALDEQLPPGDRLLCLGLQAAALLRAGDPVQALRVSGEALALMERYPPTSSVAYHSVTAVAATYLALERRQEAMEGTGRAIRVLEGFAGRVRIGRPLAAWMAGQYALLHDADQHTAAKHWERGVTLAEALTMPIEEALCHRGLARLGGCHDPAGAHGAHGAHLLNQHAARPWLEAGLA
jgi:adenylate cyclase